MFVMRRFGGIFALILMLLAGVVAGCGQEDANETTTSAANSQNETTVSETENGEGPEEFYKDETVKIVVPYKPGGGYDTYARMVSNYLEDELQATVVVQNMPGGDTYVANNYVFNADPDGLTLQIASKQGLTVVQLIGEERGEGIDIREYEWLAQLINEPPVVVLREDPALKTFEDLQSVDNLRFGSSASNTLMAASAFLELTGIDGEVVRGFSGTSDVAMSIMREELDGQVTSAGSAYDYGQQPEMFELCTVANEKSPLSPDLPTLEEFAGLSSEETEYLGRISNVLGTGRVFLTTPGVPEERVEFLRTALGNVLQNEEFVAQAEDINRLIDYMPGEEVAQSVIDLLSMPDDEAAELQDILLHKYTVE